MMLLGRGDLTTALGSVARIATCDQRAGGFRQEAGNQPDVIGHEQALSVARSGSNAIRCIWPANARG
jgi:hypothetical protein